MYSSRILIMTQLLKISKFKVRPSFLQENQNAVKSAPYRIEGKTLSAKIHNLSTQRKYWQNKLQKLHHIGANECSHLSATHLPGYVLRPRILKLKESERF